MQCKLKRQQRWAAEHIGPRWFKIIRRQPADPGCYIVVEAVPGSKFWGIKDKYSAIITDEANMKLKLNVPYLGDNPKVALNLADKDIIS